MASGKVCDSDVIPASFCENRACNYVFKVLSSSCPLNTNINITVGVSGSGFSKQIIIGVYSRLIVNTCTVELYQ